MKLTIVSGGQSGVDLGGLRASKARGIPTGGWAPKGWLQETADGKRHVPNPSLGPEFGLKEHPSWGYPARTVSNIHDADATLIVVDRTPLTGGTGLTFTTAREIGRQRGSLRLCLYVADLSSRASPTECAEWLKEVIGTREAFTLNVAGPWESGAPGIGARAEAFVGKVLDLLVEGATRDS